ncbi:neutral/alkaline ceramidase [Cognaticolwellia mytili]|uniref:neutral/alkaline ceramidase n=1 Tax=Cognaticolwellia mytili TaxID=1888913 RepID=UPI000A17173F|nr:neutral/alkaline ceramidase [Cognaticolwellia mytili]
MIKKIMTRLAIATTWCLASFYSLASDNYLVGRGIHDVTGPAAEVGMMGYAELNQKTSGILDRQWARAFVVAEPNGKRVVFVNVDQGAVFQSITQGVVAKLKNKYNGLYHEDNIILSATHTHGSAGGHSNYALYNVTVLGFIKQNYDVIVDGIYQAIVKAHNDLKPGSLYLNKGDLTTASINRSIEAFNSNPESGNTSSIDPEMTVLKFTQNGHEVGMINWFATHGVSMPKTNTLLTSDNKGYAQYLFEKKLKNSNYRDNDDFVAAFAQSNAGDMTPNLNLDGTGPASDPLSSTKIIGQRQYDKAVSLYNSASEKVTGDIDFRHRHVDFSAQTVGAEFTDGVAKSTCKAALGTAFGAGTEDGRGLDFFSEGDLNSNPFWSVITWVLSQPTAEQAECHLPKPILVAQGNFQPYPWSPDVLPVSIIKIGQLGLLAVPGEFTITAGRRLKNTVATVDGTGINHLVVAGYANAYSGYVTTKEEYDVQHYEGGSTHFGPWTLAAYQQSFKRLANSLATDIAPEFPENEPTLRELADSQLNFQTGVVHDQAPIFKSIGQVVNQPRRQYSAGEIAKATFWSGHPKNNLNTMGSFLAVQQLIGNTWKTVLNDNDWETRYHWQRIDGFWGTSQVTIEWHIPNNVKAGDYRLVHYGHEKKPFSGSIKSYTGVSRNFQVN